MCQSFTLKISTNNPTCGKNNGILDIEPMGGIAPYSFTLTGFSPRSLGFFNYMNPGIYGITVTDALGNVAEGSATLVNIYSAPNASVEYTRSSGCMTNDASITITGSGGTFPYTYSIDQVTYQPSNQFNSINAGSYRYVVKDANGCESERSDFNNLLITPSCPITNGNGGITLSYSCNPFLTYLGLGVQGGTPPYFFSLDGINYQTENNYPNGVPKGLYTFWVKDAANLIMKFAIAVSDKCKPQIIVNTIVKSASCGINGVITAIASNGKAPYSYTIDGVNFQTANSFSGLIPGNYTLIVKDLYGEVNSVLVTVPNNCIIVNASSVNSTCSAANGSITIVASNGVAPYQYSITGISFSSNNKFIDLAAGTYKIQVKDATGNTMLITEKVIDSGGPQIINVSSTPTSCSINNGTIIIKAQGGTIPLSYSSNGISFTFNPVFTAMGASPYNMVVKDINGCTSTETITIPVDNSSLKVDAGNIFPVCESKTVMLKGSTNAQQFTWLPDKTLINLLSLTPTASPKVDTWYYLTGTTGNCTKTDSVLSVVLQAPIAHVGAGQTICYGANATLSGSGSGLVSFTWSPTTYLDNSNSPNPLVIKPNITTQYSLAVKDANGCVSVAGNFVAITVIAAAKVFAGNDTSIAISQSLSLSAFDVNGSGFTSYTWSPASGLSNPSIKNPIANLNANGTYVVVASTPEHCEAKDTIRIQVFKESDIFVPSAFTPNGDGKNDFLKAIPIGIKKFNYFIIYNRYGQLVFNTTDPALGWNGSFKNEFFNTSAFVWAVNGIDFLNHVIMRKGTVLLIR